MSGPTRSIPSHIRAASGAASSGASPALVARIEEKRAELEHLKELRDLSGAVATQMEALEQKLSTLSDGTEGKAATGLFSAFLEHGLTYRQRLRRSWAIGTMYCAPSTWLPVSLLLLCLLLEIGRLTAEPTSETRAYTK